ncbi:MAG: hypothetical protein GY803_30825 [Chloroflexi bacterium]|nr:hypothetical protein [Chloroflexota bacterium]
MMALAQTRLLWAQTPVSDDVFVVQDEAFELEVIRLTNIERTSRGLYPLKRNLDLIDAARLHNQDMIDNNFTDHIGSDDSTPAERACRAGYTPYGWGDCYVGENIAWGYTTPSSVVQGWMNSQGHKDNILNPNYREIGVGHNVGGTYGNYWTMGLGAQPSVLPVFINDDDEETTTRDVTMTLTKEDVSSWGSIGDITGVKISEDSSFTGVSWQSWAQNLPFTLSPGNGTKTVYVRFTDGSNEVTSSDMIELNEPVPYLAVSPSSVTLLAEVGSGQTIPETAVISIENNGGDVLMWTAVPEQTWLQLDKGSGTAPDSITALVDNSGGILDSVGTKTADITVTATNPDAQNTPQTVSVSVLVVNTIYDVYLPVIQR